MILLKGVRLHLPLLKTLQCLLSSFRVKTRDLTCRKDPWLFLSCPHPLDSLLLSYYSQITHHTPVTLHLLLFSEHTWWDHLSQDLALPIFSARKALSLDIHCQILSSKSSSAKPPASISYFLFSAYFAPWNADFLTQRYPM